MKTAIHRPVNQKLVINFRTKVKENEDTYIFNCNCLVEIDELSSYIGIIIHTDIFCLATTQKLDGSSHTL